MYWRWDRDDLVLACHLQPGASSNAFAGAHGDRLKIRIAAPPIDGKANAQLIAFLADAFAVAKQQVTIERGESGRQKSVRIAKPKLLPAELEITSRIAPRPPSK